MHYVFGFVHHLRQVRRWARARGARLEFDPQTFHLLIGVPGKPAARFHPRFIFQTPDKISGYTHEFGEEGGFVGWLPYWGKRWPAAADKIVFKRYCEHVGIRTPAAWPCSESAPHDYIVKPRNGSFGRNIRGPYRAAMTTAEAAAPGELDYCEQFIKGESVKLWYWNEAPLVMERIAAPYLIGDGVRTLRELGADVRGSFDRVHDIESCSDILAWQGWTPASVVPKGAHVQVDFKYATPFDAIDMSNRNVLAKQSPELRAELQRIGDLLYRTVPENLRPHAIYTVDGMLDEQGALWLLEMNCNPVVHPSCYEAMLDGVFGAG